MKQWCIGALMLLTLMTVEARARQDNVVAGDRLSVVTTMFPAYDFTREIAGTAVSLSILLPPGAESHSFEPTPQDIIRIQNSAIFICVGGESESWVERVLSSMDTSRLRIIRLMDCVQTVEEEVVEGMQAEEEEDVAYDEHVWTSPRNAMRIVEQIAAALVALDARNAADYQQRATAYLAKLETLDAAFRDAVAAGTRKTIVFGDRFPFRYLADEYGLSYFAAFPGCSTETEPSAATIAFLIRKMREEHIPVIFHIELSNERMADMISEETGATKRLLHACHNISKRDFDQGRTYLELMNQNVINLREALR